MRRPYRDGDKTSIEMPFEDVPTVPAAEELIDTAFSRAARAGRAKTGVDAQQSMLDVAGNILSDNLDNVVQEWPDLDRLHPFFATLVDALVGLETLKQDLASVGWAGNQIERIAREHRSRLRGDADVARRHRQQAFARMADVVEEVEEALSSLEMARRELAKIPGIDPTAPTLVIAGYPNVGKSTFLNAVTRANVETATYPFTTTAIGIGHVTHRHITYQVIDTPGLLDRPLEERNEIERQAVAALEHLADTVLVFVDPSETCGYPLSDQLALRDRLTQRFESRDIPVLTICSKADLSRSIAADVYLSVHEEDGVEATLQAGLDAIDYQPPLPHEGDVSE